MDKLTGKIYRYKSVSSTNDLAKVLANEGKPEGTIILAEEQKQGRGKWNRHWISPGGEGIWMSMILKPRLSSSELALMTLMTAVAIVKALRNYLGLKAKIKWPNDILVRGKKIAGILTEMKEEKYKVKFVIIGIGLNTHLDLNKLPRGLKGCVTSVKQEFSHRFSREKLMGEIIKEISHYYSLFKKGGFSIIREEWKSYSSILGRQIETKHLGKKVFGQAIGLSETGSLLLRRDTGVIEEVFGSDIHII